MVKTVPISEHPPVASELAAWLSGQVPLAYGVARRVLGNQSDAEDAVQEGFIRYLRSADQTRAEAERRGFLVRLVLDSCQKLARAGERRRRRESRTMELALTTKTDGCAVEKTEIQEIVNRAVLGLDDTYRLPIQLHYYQGLDSREIAHALGISQTATTTRLSRGLDKLHDALKRTAPLSIAMLVATMRDSPAIEVPPVFASAVVAAAHQGSAASLSLFSLWPKLAWLSAAGAAGTSGVFFSCTTQKEIPS